MDYDDNPINVESWLDTLSTAELKAFEMGFTVALQSVLEQISESKMKILNRMMGEEDGTEEKRQLLSKYLLLETYEQHFSSRVKVLKEIKHV